MGNVEKFYDALMKDEALRDKANGLNEKYKGKQLNEEEVIVDLIAFANSAGYSFTAEEYKTFAQKNPEKMSEDDLKAVAGGSFNKSACYCIIAGSHKDRSGDRDRCFCVAIGVSSNDNLENLVCLGLGFVVDANPYH
jgi:predicted ribosomally synthesized peptide with nif11-like leader